MELLQLLLPLLALSLCCQGAAIPEDGSLELESLLDTFQNLVANPSMLMDSFSTRTKRSAEDHTGFTVIPIPLVGEVGVKYKDPSDHLKGGEAFLHIFDLQSHIPAAHSKDVKLHVKFDGGASTRDGLFTAEVDYHLTHKDGDGTEEGSLKITREKRGGKWHTNIKTEAAPFSGTPIIPARISNLEFNLESDRQTTLNAHYVNVPMHRDLKIDVVRVPGQNIQATINNKGQVSTVTGTITASGNDKTVHIEANHKGQQYVGEVSVQRVPNKPTKVSVDVKRGQESVLQAQLMVKVGNQQGKAIGKYSVMGGKVGQGKIDATYKNDHYVVEISPYKLSMIIKLGEKLKMVAEKNGHKLWSYETERGDKSTPDAFIYEAHSEMEFTQAALTESVIVKFIRDHYPFGAFMTRTNTIRVYVDKHHRNTVLRKFKIDFDVVKDGQNVVDIVADTTVSPYNFVISAPNLFRKLHIPQDSVTVTVDHVRGSHLNIHANVGGGLDLESSQAPNSLGGRTINIITKKGGVQMMKYHADTSKVNNAAMLKVGLKGEMELNPDSFLYRMVVGRYHILTPFAKRTSDLEFMWDKVHKNVVLNKFSAKAKVDKDGTNVLNLEISTEHKPYKLHIFCPALFGKLRNGMTEVDVTVDHELGQHLYVNVNHAGAKWKGFKITSTGNGNQREIEWDGKKLGQGSYELTDHRFTTTQTLSNGKSLTTTINWKNKWDSASFFLDNKVHVVLDGTERRLNLNMEWGMDRIPDGNPRTADGGHFKMDAIGHNAILGDYKVARDLTWHSANSKITVDLTGEASFEQGPLAAKSPIHTEIKFSYDIAHNDLEGKFMKTLAGKEYSVTFPAGSFKMPSIKLGA